MNLADAIITASTAIVVSAAPAFASACASSHDIIVSRALGKATQSAVRSVRHRSKLPPLCQFIFMNRLHCARLPRLVGDADREQNLALLDAEIDAFNNLLATKCAS